MNVVPTLAELITDPAKAANFPPEAVPALLGDLERLKATLWARLTVPQNGQGQAQGNGDRLLTAKEAAAKLGMSEDYLYRNGSKLPFVVRIGRQVRYSEAGIEKFIKQRSGR